MAYMQRGFRTGGGSGSGYSKFGGGSAGSTSSARRLIKPGGVAAAAPSLPSAGWGVSQAGPGYSTFGGGGASDVSASGEADPALEDIFGIAKAGIDSSDPFIDEAIRNYRSRLSEDNTQRTIDVTNQRVNQQEAGAQQQLKERLAMSGDTGGAEAGAQAVSAEAQRAKAGNAATIQLQREQQLDNLVMQGSQILGMPAQRRLQYLNAAAGLAGGVAGSRASSAERGLEAQRIRAQVAAQQAAATSDWWKTLWSMA